MSLRKTQDMDDVDSEYCVYWGDIFSGQASTEGWIKMEKGGYLPTKIDGRKVIRTTSEDHTSDSSSSPTPHDGHQQDNTGRKQQYAQPTTPHTNHAKHHHNTET